MKKPKECSPEIDFSFIPHLVAEYSMCGSDHRICTPHHTSHHILKIILRIRCESVQPSDSISVLSIDQNRTEQNILLLYDALF